MANIEWARSTMITTMITFGLLAIAHLAHADWDSWWTYEGISGPDFWGRLNPKWSHCSKGHRQSPINLGPEHIIYDPNLRDLSLKGNQLAGRLVNTGRSISFLVDEKAKPVQLSGGPFSYQYTVSNVTLHFGRENNRGSEHTLDGVQFAGELQVYAFNAELYSNWSEAKRSPNGLVAIAALIKLTKNQLTANGQLKSITNQLKNISNRGDVMSIEPISVRELLPDLRHYLTYEGSLTQPACFETVQWVVLNRPIYLSANQLHQLRTSLKGDGHQDNFRPVQELNHRTIRTNIDNPINPNNSNKMAGSYANFGSNDSTSLAAGSSSEEREHQPRWTQSAATFSREMCLVQRPVSYQVNQKQFENFAKGDAGAL